MVWCFSGSVRVVLSWLAVVVVAHAAQGRQAAVAGGKWQLVRSAPAGLSNPLLLTDGTVIAAEANSPYWFRLKPDVNGDYATGSWSRIASLPVIGRVQYAPEFFASAVLPDGRVLIEGGEYNFSQSASTNMGAIYDPVADRWSAVPPPAGRDWAYIGDAQSVVLATGQFMLGRCCSFAPSVNALFDAKSLTWTSTGAPSAGGGDQDEQGYTLLPNGRVLTVDIWTDAAAGGDATNAEAYDPRSGLWGSEGNTPVSLVDPAQCGYDEIGPAVIRGNGTVVAFGGNTGCVSGASADPTAILDASSGRWKAGPYLPSVCGADGVTACSMADAPAASLPDGNILFAASAGYGIAPTHFFEFGTGGTIGQVDDETLNAPSTPGYYYNFLVLPTGQVLSTDMGRIAEIYTPAGVPVANWAPVVTSAPATIVRGNAYQIKGKQLSGRTSGAAFGDDAQSATNYPIVQVINTSTKHVFYERSFGHSTMSIAPNALGSTHFILSAAAEAGASSLRVIANGIASQPVDVVVQ